MQTTVIVLYPTAVIVTSTSNAWTALRATVVFVFLWDTMITRAVMMMMICHDTRTVTIIANQTKVR